MLSLTSFLALNSLLRLSLFFFSVNTNAIKEHNITISNAWRRVEKRYRVHPSSLFLDDINDDDDDEKEEEDSFFHPLIARALLFYSFALFFITRLIVSNTNYCFCVTNKNEKQLEKLQNIIESVRDDDDASHAYRDRKRKEVRKKKSSSRDVGFVASKHTRTRIFFKHRRKHKL